MRRIEQQLVEAIRENRPFRKDNTAYVLEDEWLYGWKRLDGFGIPGLSTEHVGVVRLHNNIIAFIDLRLEDKTPFSICFSGWLTPTTKSRIRALGVNTYTKKGVTYVDHPFKDLFSVALHPNGVSSRTPLVFKRNDARIFLYNANL